jgi:hypothetical protein
MAGFMDKFLYSSDDGNDYTVRLDTSNVAAFDGAITSVTSRPNLPHGYRMRYLECVDDADVTGGRTPTNARRKIYALNVTDSQWVGGSNTITLEDYHVHPSVSVAFTIVGRVGEKRYAR